MNDPSATRGLDEASAEFGLAGLFLAPSPQRVARFVGASRTELDWGRLLAHLESHGVLGLFRRNLALAGLAPPPGAQARLAERTQALLQDTERFRFTLQRFLAEATARNVLPILLKGSSLALDLYPDPSLRTQGDIDLLLDPSELERALRAGCAAGLIEGPEALPGWWYRWVHFHRKLLPSAALLREVEVHWALHHPSLLHTVRGRALSSRSQAVRVFGFPARTLEPMDRFLHLVTHLGSHARGTVGPPERTTLRAVLSALGSPLRFKWIVDVHGEWEQRSDAWSARALVERIREWNAERQVAEVLALVRGGLGFEGTADGLCSDVLRELGPPRNVRSRVRGRGELLEGLDLRPSALARIGPWMFPPAEFLARRYGARGALHRNLSRVVHAGGVAGHLGMAFLAFPVALAGRAWLRPERRRGLAAASSPEKTLDLAVAWRRFVAAEAGVRTALGAVGEARGHS